MVGWQGALIVMRRLLHPIAIFWVVIGLLLTFVSIVAIHDHTYGGKGGAGIAVSQNGYSVIWSSSSPQLYWWKIPGETRKFQLRDGPAGYVLAAHAYWYHRTIGGFSLRADDWGYSLRGIQNSTDWSNHASGTAIDINALNHPQGRYGTYTNAEVNTIEERLELFRGVIRWGGNYRGLPDEMHWEINATPAQVKALATWLRSTYYGKLLSQANPGH